MKLIFSSFIKTMTNESSTKRQQRTYMFLMQNLSVQYPGRRLRMSVNYHKFTVNSSLYTATFPEDSIRPLDRFGFYLVSVKLMKTSWHRSHGTAFESLVLKSCEIRV